MGCQIDKNDDIDVSMLNVGDCISYKKMCELTNQPYYTGGDQKKKQLQNFERYFSYDKEKTKYTITDIYDKPLDVGYKYPPNTLYTELIEKILLQYLSTQPGYKTYISSNKLWYQLGMINGYFLRYKNEYNKLIELNPTMTLFEVSDFYRRCWSKFSTIIDNSFKSLQRQNLILFSKVYRIIKIDNEGQAELHEASELEAKEILKVRRKVLVEFGFKSMNQVVLGKRSREFYSRMDELFLEKYGWSNVFLTYKIIYNREDIIEAISLEELDESKKFLNDRIVAALSQNAEYNYNKAGIDKIQDSDGNIPDGVFYYPAKYVEKQDWLSHTLVKLRDKDSIDLVEMEEFINLFE